MSTEWRLIGEAEKHEAELGLPQDWTGSDIALSAGGGTRVYVDPVKLLAILERYGDAEVVEGDDQGPVSASWFAGVVRGAAYEAPEEVDAEAMASLRRSGWIRDEGDGERLYMHRDPSRVPYTEE